MFLAEHALAPEDYPESGLNVPYVFLIVERYGNLIELQYSGPMLKIAGPFMRLIARIRGLQIPDEPLPVRDPSAGSSLRPGETDSDASARSRSGSPETATEDRGFR